MKMEQTNLNPARDTINHPAHYTQGGVECIEAMKAATVNKKPFEAVLVGNVIKYLWRYEAKGGIEDVEKAMWYLGRLYKEMIDERMRYKIIANENGRGLETPWHTLMFPKEGDMFNPKGEVRANLLKALLERGGYCPCQPKQDRDTMCPCKTYRTEGKCICGLFTKIPSVVTDEVEKEATKEDVEVEENGETESIGTDSTPTDSEE